MTVVRTMLPALLLALFTLAGCRADTSQPYEITDADKLTRDEYIALVNTCRAVLSDPKLDLTDEQRAFIRKQPPAFRIDYTGHKEGLYNMTWHLPGGVAASVIGEGQVMKSSCRVRISLVRF